MFLEFDNVHLVVVRSYLEAIGGEHGLVSNLSSIALKSRGVRASQPQ